METSWDVFGVGSFAWGVSRGRFNLGAFVWERQLGNVCLGIVVFFRSETVAWDLVFENCSWRAFAWEVSFGDFGFGWTVGRGLSHKNIGSGNVPWELSFRCCGLRKFDWRLAFGKLRVGNLAEKFSRWNLC